MAKYIAYGPSREKILKSKLKRAARRTKYVPAITYRNKDIKIS
jgi:hypothetical protein